MLGMEAPGPQTERRRARGSVVLPGICWAVQLLTGQETEQNLEGVSSREVRASALRAGLSVFLSGDF